MDSLWVGGGVSYVLLSTTQKIFLKNKVNKNYFVSQLFNTLLRDKKKNFIDNIIDIRFISFVLNKS